MLILYHNHYYGKQIFSKFTVLGLRYIGHLSVDLFHDGIDFFYFIIFNFHSLYFFLHIFLIYAILRVQRDF